MGETLLNGILMFKRHRGNFLLLVRAELKLAIFTDKLQAAE